VVWFFRRRKEPPSRERLLRGVPVLNQMVEWQEHEGKVRLTIPRTGNWKTRILSLLFHIPKEHIVELDSVGEQVIRLCDGRRTVKEISRRLARSRHLNQREAEAALLQYLEGLVRRSIIGIAIPPPRKHRRRK
jgi:hypothetical protein